MSKYKQCFCAPVFLLALMLWALPAAAENVSAETKDSEPPAETVALDDITVKEKKSDTRFSAELAEYGHPVTVVTGDQIREGGFVDLSAAVEALVPGFFSNQRQGRGGWTFNYIHGSDKILWLLDGVRITNPLYNSDWSTTLSLHLIDRIEVLSGGESLFYGTGARGGVINIITKEVTDKTSGEFGTSFGELGFREVYGHATDTFNGHGLMAFGSFDGADGYQVCDDQSYADAQYTDKKHEVGYDRSAVGAKYRRAFDLAGKAVLSAQLQEHQGYFDYPYPIYRNAYNDWEEELGILKWDHDVNKHFSYYLKSHFHTWWGKVTFTNPDGSYAWGYDRSNESVWGYEDYGANLATSTRWGGGQEMIVGFDYQNYWGKEEVMGVPSTDRTQSYGVFASYRPYLPFAPRVKTSLGGRYTTTNEDVEATIWDFSVRTPLVGATYLRGLVGTTFTLPTLMQLYGTDIAGGTVGNPDLEPEESLNTEVGIGGEWKVFRLDVSYFYQDVRDMIAGVTLPSGDASYDNIDGNTKIDGYEVQAGIGPFSGVSLNLSATWVSAEDTDTDQQLERIPEFYGSANLGYRTPAGKYGADLMTRYTGDIYERGLAPFADVEFGDYFVADASAFVRFGRELRHKLTLRVENIFDEEYATQWNRTTNPDGEYFSYSQNGMPRNFIVGYAYTF
jgi:vitamin B12 transporter